MRIIEIIPCLLKRAGAETFFVSLCCELSKYNQVVVVCLFDGIDQEYKKRFEEHNVNVLYCGKKVGFDISSNKKLRNIVKEYMPDVVHTHLGCIVSYVGAFGFRNQCFKLFHTCHTIASKEANLVNRILRKKLIKKGLLNLISISKLVAKTYEELYKVKNIPVIINGIKVENVFFNSKKEYDLIQVGRFCETKNHLFTLDIISKLCKRYENLKCCFLGDGALKNNIIAKAKEMNIFERIDFVGEVSNVYDYLLKSRVFILPSIYEGVPISILEAYNAGLPVIVSNVGGVSEIVSNKNGFLISDNSCNDFIEAFDKLQSISLYDKISAYNRLSIQEYSINLCAQQYVRLFKGENR